MFPNSFLGKFLIISLESRRKRRTHGVYTMDLVKLLKTNWITLILLFITLLVLLAGISDSTYVIMCYVMLGFLLAWLIYSAGFLSIHIASENTAQDKHTSQTYYSMKEWHLVDKKRDQLLIKALMLITILVIVFVLLFERLNQFPSFFTPELNDSIKFFVVNSWQIFAGIFLIIYIIVLILLIMKRLPEEMLNVFRGVVNIAIFCLGFVIYIAISVWAVINEFLSIEAVLVGFLILPIALVINRVEGKFFYLFAINQWNQFRKYDFLEGSQIHETSSSFFKQLKALIALLILPISLVSTLLGIIDVMTGNLGIDNESLLATFIDSFLNTFPDLSTLVLFLVTMGPLLVLIFRPFAFVEVWLNQGLYEKMASPWDLDTLNDNMTKYSSLFRIAHKTRGFRWSLFLSGASILSLLGLSFVSSFITAESQVYMYIQEGLILITFVTSIIFILTLLQLTWDPIEEKTLLLFGRESRRSKIDLVNYSLYGEWLLHETSDMEIYLKSCPIHWGLPWFLKGLNLFYSDEDRLMAFERALDNQTFLLKSITPIAWNDYGVLLTQSGRNEEALDAFLKGQKALDKSEEEVMREMKEIIARESEPLLVENMMIGEPLAQTAMDIPMYAQMAMDGGDPSPETPPERKGRLLSYDELVGAENKENLVSLLDQRYSRRSRSKLNRNLAYLMQLRDDLESNWATIKELDNYLAENPNDNEKWIELAEICEKMSFLKKARTSYQKAAELYKSQGNNERYTQIIRKLEDLGELDIE